MECLLLNINGTCNHYIASQATYSVLVHYYACTCNSYVHVCVIVCYLLLLLCCLRNAMIRVLSRLLSLLLGQTRRVVGLELLRLLGQGE